MQYEFDKKAPLTTQILQLLSSQEGGLGITDLQVLLCTHDQPYISRDVLHGVMEHLSVLHRVARVTDGPLQLARWRISEASSADLHIDPPQPPIREAAIEEDEEAELPVVSNAMLCVAEHELDAWWDGYDVEVKSAIFAFFVLGSDRPVSRGIEADMPNARIRVMGTVGEVSA